MATLNEILKIAGSLENAERMAREKSSEDSQFLLDLELVLSARGKTREAKNLIDFLSEKYPEDNRIAFNKAWHTLSASDLQKGMEFLDRGRFVGVFGSPPLSHGKPVWDGKNVSGKTVLLRCEGGLGDEIINIRFAEEISKKGAKVLVSCSKGLKSLFARVTGVSKVISHDELRSHMYYTWVPAMSSARLCGFDYKTLPNKSYITPLPKKVLEWSKIIPKKEGELRVGIRWSGNPQFEHEQFRKFPVEPMFNLSDIPGVKLFSLQKDDDLKILPPNIEDLNSRLQTWEDTAGAIANLDLVITSCTSVAHLSAGMGKETWVIVPIMPYYIWAVPGEKSPWYDSVRIFRQTEEDNWSEPFLKIRSALQKKAEVFGNVPKIEENNKKTMAQNETKKTLHFVAGLPRAGSTMLISLLAQNPDISGAPVSGLCGIVNGVNVNWDKIGFHKETPNEKAKINTLRAVLDNYHKDTEKSVILDKERNWVRSIDLLESVLERRVKMIMPVRPVVEILASFESLRQKNPLTVTEVDEFLGAKSTLETRCEYFMDANGPVGSCYNYMKDAVISGFKDRMLFVDYNKFMSNPEKELERIYDFLELPYFSHDFGDIKQLVKTDDSVWKYPGLHTVRQTLERKSPDPMAILGPEMVAKYSRVEPWENWT